MFKRDEDGNEYFATNIIEASAVAFAIYLLGVITGYLLAT